jgi:predicted permease
MIPAECPRIRPVLAVLLVTFPFFALVFAGYVAARRRMLPFEAIGGLNVFVLYFALPCMLYRFGASTPIAQLLDLATGGVYLLCALLMVAGTVKFSMNERIRWNDAAFGALVAAFPNTGFMGVPLLVALLGEQAAGPVLGTVLVDLFLTSSLCIALAQAAPTDKVNAPRGSTVAAALRSLRGPMGNPLPWAIGLGALLAASGRELPGPLAQIVKMVADAQSKAEQANLWKLVDEYATVDALQEFCGTKLNLQKRAWTAVATCVDPT